MEHFAALLFRIQSDLPVAFARLVSLSDGRSADLHFVSQAGSEQVGFDADYWFVVRVDLPCLGAVVDSLSVRLVELR